MILAVQDIAEAVDAAPDVPERQRDEVRGLAGDLIKDCLLYTSDAADE